MTKAERRTIEKEFFRYTENSRKAASYIEMHAADGIAIDQTSPRVIATPRNGVERAVICLVNEEERARRWSFIFDKTLERFRWTMKDELMRRRYIRQEHYLLTCAALHLSPKAYYHWRREVLEVAFLWAKELKIL